MKRIEMQGKTFGTLTVLELGVPSKQGQARWVCLCECGKKTLVMGKDLRNGHIKWCGCVIKQRLLELSTTHNLSKTSEYRIWGLMKYRCFNKNCKAYQYYGGRGISVCYEWIESFENFIQDMGFRPSKKHSLDRYPNKNGNYEISNCRWATQKEQMHNTNRNSK